MVGASGLVGEKFLQTLERRNFPVGDLVLYSTWRSAGRKMSFRDKEYTVVELNDHSLRNFDLALFSAGSAVARQWAGKFVQQGALVVDNSSAFRKEEDIPLIVPEVNGDAVKKHRGIIANPNCSTIGLVMALYPLHQIFRLKSIIVASFQSVSGAGRRARNELREQLSGGSAEPEIFPRQIGGNVIPQIGDFLSGGETFEEEKFRSESRKIMGLADLEVAATAVRVPVEVGHSLSVHAEFALTPHLDSAIERLEQSPGLILLKNPQDFPTPRQIAGRDEVFIGRLRQTPGFPNGLDLWLCCDNLLKGAALNAVQIAELALLG